MPDRTPEKETSEKATPEVIQPGRTVPGKAVPAKASPGRAAPGKVAPAKAVPTPEYPITQLAVIAPIVGWLIPGAGHILLKRYVRGLLLFISVVAMFLIGLAMQGRIYKPNGGDILDILGFVGDVGAGGLYFLARIMDWGNVMAANAAADYGKTSQPRNGPYGA